MAISNYRPIMAVVQLSRPEPRRVCAGRDPHSSIMQTIATPPSALLPPTWSAEHIFSLAPTLTVAKSSQTTAASTRWRELSRDDVRIWGVYPHNLQSVIQTSVNLNTFATACSCTNRGRPCSHILALMLIALDQPERFTVGPAPDWHVDAATTAKDKEDMGQADTESDRLGQMQTGMVELETWLGDMIHQGLAELPNRPKSYWQRMIDRLTDARAHEVAQQLREISTIPNSNPDWPDHLLRQIGRLYLLTQGFRHIDQLPVINRVDLLAAVGWTPPLNPADRVADRWVVLGSSIRPMARQQLQQTWLFGCNSERFALHEQIIRHTDPVQFLLPGGATFATTLTFSHSAHPLHARLPLPTMITIDTPDLDKLGSSITEAHRRYRNAVSVNPWLRRFPMLLSQITPTLQFEQWEVHGNDGARLPLPPDFGMGWHLLAFSGGRPLTLIGEWDGTHLHPLTVYTADDWIDLRTLRAIR
ncbi:MAG: SWIM zinc finger family protein [Anaerolineae bacterium]|nr:SWIM zinc finger family protein [Anaerolineae bacterium]